MNARWKFDETTLRALGEAGWTPGRRESRSAVWVPELRDWGFHMNYQAQ